MLTEDQIKKNLKRVKIKEDFIIVHSDITGLIFRNFSIKKLWKIIFEAFGKNKTYIFPTFTFDNKKKNWHYKNSKSQSGILSEYFRKNVAKKRTIHPIHSVSIYGIKHNKVPNHNSNSSFGKGSTWDWLCNSKNVCNIGLGLNLHGGGTFCHYSEEKCKVNYRQYKNIDLKVISKKNILSKRKFTYFAKSLDIKNIKNDWKKCEKDLIKNKLLKKFKFKENNYSIIKMNTFKTTKFILKKLKKNQYYLTNRKLFS